MGVDFEEGGNQSARRKPSKSGWDRLKLNPHTKLVVEVEDVIDVHYASLTSQGVQHREFIQMVTHPDINPIQQGLILVNGLEPVFLFGDSCTIYNTSSFFKGSNWMIIVIVLWAPLQLTPTPNTIEAIITRIGPSSLRNDSNTASFPSSGVTSPVKDFSNYLAHTYLALALT